MDTELSISDTMSVASPQISLVKYPNRATMWACSQCEKYAEPDVTLTRGDIRGFLSNNYAYASRSTHFNELVLIVFSEIDWDFVYDYYKEKICKK